jgi:hypothetical protein
MTLRIGDKVIVSEHQLIDGVKNWDLDMMNYVGKEAIITGEGSKEYLDNCIINTYTIDLDEQSYHWRECNLTLVSNNSYFKDSGFKDSGAFCKRCNDYAPYVEPSNSFICYRCKH